jgi:hypothetical protein
MAVCRRTCVDCIFFSCFFQSIATSGSELELQETTRHVNNKTWMKKNKKKLMDCTGLVVSKYEI